MTVKELKEMLSKLDETKEIKVAVPPNMEEGVYPVAVVLPNNAYILLGSKKTEPRKGILAERGCSISHCCCSL